MKQSTILIVEDDSSLREVLGETLRLEGYHIVTASNGNEAMKVLRSNDEIKLLLSDVQMQPMSGHDLLKVCRENYPTLPFILMTAYGTIESAVQTLHDGAADYLTKPFDSQTLVEMVSRFVSPINNESKGDFVAADQTSVQLAEVAKRVALTEASVMISGESGVGKEVISRFIHENSSRASGPFVAINCAAIPENMLESELFGYEKGAFTGAYKSKSGKFEQAQGGTLLLDEITEMDFALQAKLLRVLQEREVERLGGRKAIPLDVRILSTTNRNIYQAVAEGQFREDQFYRLNVFPLCIPPLRDRTNDILPIAKKILKNHSTNTEPVHFSESANILLKTHAWPGNVRELDNVIQRALILKSGNTIKARDIHIENNNHEFQLHTPVSRQVEQPEPDLSNDLKAHEQDLIISALKARNSRKEVAERLGISSRTLRYKLAKMRDAGVAIPA